VTFPARANITVDLDLDGLTLLRAVAVPAFPLVANGRFAPTALERPRPAIAEWDQFDCCSPGPSSLYGQGLDEFQHSKPLAMRLRCCKLEKIYSRPKTIGAAGIPVLLPARDHRSTPNFYLMAIVIGEMPPPPAPDVRCPRGPFCLPLRTRAVPYRPPILKTKFDDRAVVLSLKGRRIHFPDEMNFSNAG
jgi:hypothetical protein